MLHRGRQPVILRVAAGDHASLTPVDLVVYPQNANGCPTVLTYLPHDVAGCPPGSGAAATQHQPGPGDDVEVMRVKLLTLCRAREHLARACNWTGIGVISNAPSTVAVLVQLDELWAADPALDQFVEPMGPAL